MSESKSLTGADIFSADSGPPRLERVELPEAGGHAHVRLMDGPTWSRFERVLADHRTEEGDGLTDPDAVKAWLLVLTVTDADGKALFTEADLGRLAAVNNYRLTAPLVAASQRVNGLTEDAARESAQNSDAGPAAS